MAFLQKNIYESITYDDIVNNVSANTVIDIFIN